MGYNELFIWLIQKSLFRFLHQLNEKFKEWILYSNRLYVNLDQALSMNYGDTSDGPTGTGKTKTEKTPLVRFCRYLIILFLIIIIILFQFSSYI